VKKKSETTDSNCGEDRVVVGPFALDEAMEDFRINLGDVGQLDLVDLGAFAAGGGGLVGEGDVKLLRSGVELEPVDGEDVFAAVIHAARSEASVEFMSEKNGNISR
jgi:hypothetical protein